MSGVVVLGLLVGVVSTLLPRVAVELSLSIWLLVTLGVILAVAVSLTSIGLDRISLKRVGERDQLPIVVGLAFFATQFSGVGVPWNPSSLVFLLLVIYWLAYRVMNPGEPLQLPPVSWLFLALLAVMFLSLVGRDPGLLTGIFRHFAKFISPVLVIDLLNTKRRLYKLTKFYLALMGCIGFVGIMQQVIWRSTGVVLTLCEEGWAAYRGALMRATGFAGHGNTYGEHVLIAGIVALFLLLWKGRQYSSRSLVLIVSMTLFAAYFSYSRLVWVAGAVGVCLIPLLLKPRSAPAWLGGGALAAAISLRLPVIGDTILEILTVGGEANFKSFTERIGLIKRGVEVMIMYPIRGAGLRNFASYDYVPESFPVHNAQLMIGSELGWPGLLLYTALVVWVIVHLTVAFRASRDPEFKGLLGGLLLACIVVAVLNQGSPMAYGLYMHHVFALGEAAALVGLRSSRKRERGTGPERGDDAEEAPPGRRGRDPNV